MKMRRTVVKKKGEESIQDCHFITYGDEKFKNSAKRICQEAEEFLSFKSIKKYNLDDLEEDFKEKYKDILKESRGGGYWIWKPYIILKRLQELKEGEYLVYLDAGCTINKEGKKRFKEYLQLLEKSTTPVLSFMIKNCFENQWTTDKIFDYFNIDKISNIRENEHYTACALIMKKCDFTINIFKKSLEVLESDPYLYTDKYNSFTNRKEFKDNRHDQSILSILRKIYGSVVLADETYFQYFGKEESLKYPFWATRKRS